MEKALLPLIGLGLGVIVTFGPRYFENSERLIRYQEQNRQLHEQNLRLQGWQEGAKDISR